MIEHKITHHFPPRLSFFSLSQSLLEFIFYYYITFPIFQYPPNISLTPFQISIFVLFFFLSISLSVSAYKLETLWTPYSFLYFLMSLSWNWVLIWMKMKYKRVRGWNSVKILINSVFLNYRIKLIENLNFLNFIYRSKLIQWPIN